MGELRGWDKGSRLRRGATHSSFPERRLGEATAKFRVPALFPCQTSVTGVEESSWMCYICDITYDLCSGAIWLRVRKVVVHIQSYTVFRAGEDSSFGKRKKQRVSIRDAPIQSVISVTGPIIISLLKKMTVLLLVMFIQSRQANGLGSGKAG